MKKGILLSVSFVIALAFSTGTAPELVAANKKEVSYKNCKALNAAYKSGVKKSKATKNKVVNRTTKKQTFKNSSGYVSASLYKLNSHLDNDKDGIACEK